MHLALHFPQSAILHFLLSMHFLWHFGSFFFLPPFFLPPFLFLACFFMRFLIHLAWHANLPHPAHTLFLKQAAWHFLPPFIICMKIGTFLRMLHAFGIAFPAKCNLALPALDALLVALRQFLLLAALLLAALPLLGMLLHAFLDTLGMACQLAAPAHTLFLKQAAWHFLPPFIICM